MHIKVKHSLFLNVFCFFQRTSVNSSSYFFGLILPQFQITNIFISCFTFSVLLIINLPLGKIRILLFFFLTSSQSVLKEISLEYSLKGLMLKLKLQYFGHLMGRTSSLEKTLILGKIEGRRRG